MKNTLLLLFCCFFLGNMSAQTFAYNVPGDFDNCPTAFFKKADGHFLIAGTTGGPEWTVGSLSLTGGPYFHADLGNVYLLDWGAETGLLNSQRLEVYGAAVLYDMVELLNGNMVASGWEYRCAGPVETTLIYMKCFDPAGNLLWTKYTDTIQLSPRWNNLNLIKLAVNPNDGKIAQLFNSKYSSTINLLDPNNGEILFKYPSSRCNGLAINPVNNNLVVITNKSITQINPNDASTISQSGLLPISAYFNHVIVDAAGTIWAIPDGSVILKWPLNGSPIALSISHIWYGTWVATGNGYAEYGETNDGNSIYFYNADFQLQSVTKLSNLANFKVTKMYLDTNTIFLAGYEEHGPGTNFTSNYGKNASSNLLIRRFNYDGTPQDTEDLDVAITEATIEVLPTFNKASNDTTWNINGGKFVVTLRNNGNVPVKEVDISADINGFLQVDTSCHLKNKSHYSFHLADINLAPGEEQTVSIDSINNVYNTAIFAVPLKICFSASAPNHRRDVNFQNDYTCLSIYETIPTVAPAQTNNGLQVFPNPATASIQIVLSAASKNPETYRILSSTGRVLQQGTIPTGATEFSVGIEEIPSGLYFVETGGVFGRFIKF